MLAVEMHQSDPASCDISMHLVLNATRPSVEIEEPVSDETAATVTILVGGRVGRFRRCAPRRPDEFAYSQSLSSAL